MVLPKPLAAGETRIAVGTSGAGPAKLSAEQFSPTLNVAFRRGLSERAELGVTFRTPLRAMVDLKLLLRAGSSEPGGVDVAVAPGFGGGVLLLNGGDFIAPLTVVEGSLPLLVGIIVGDGHQLVFSPTAGVIAATDDDFGAGAGVQAGAGFGIALRFDHFTVMPQLQLSRYWGFSGVPPTTNAEVGLVFWFGAR